jgi:hypothetical protein
MPRVLGLAAKEAQMIQEQACPRCAIKRTLYVTGRQLSICMNCRFLWSVGGPTHTWSEQPERDRIETDYQFTPAELARLAIYRDAVDGGLYTEFPTDWNRA